MLALKKKYRDKAVFIVADTNTPEGSKLAAEYDIYYIPAIFIMDGQGKKVFEGEGKYTQRKLDEYLAKAVAAN